MALGNVVTGHELRFCSPFYSNWTTRHISCAKLCSLCMISGPFLTDVSRPRYSGFDPMPALKKWLEAPFHLKKMAEGRTFTGSLTSSLGFVVVAFGRSRSTVLPSSGILSEVLSRVPSRAIHIKMLLLGEGHRGSALPLVSGSLIRASSTRDLEK